MTPRPSDLWKLRASAGRRTGLPHLIPGPTRSSPLLQIVAYAVLIPSPSTWESAACWPESECPSAFRDSHKTPAHTGTTLAVPVPRQHGQLRRLSVATVAEFHPAAAA